MGMVNTAGGPVDAKQLGQTLAHEHVNIRTPGIRENWPDRSNRSTAKASAIARINAAKALGIRSFVDLTTAVAQLYQYLDDLAQTGVVVVRRCLPDGPSSRMR